MSNHDAHASCVGSVHRNYKCYLYAFTAKEILSLTSYFGVDHIERPIVPKPLAQSMTEEEWSVKEAEQIEKEQVLPAMWCVTNAREAEIGIRWVQT